jgi:CelD/BcsL family acetyltransferase involved in cellulose biosynthesis
LRRQAFGGPGDILGLVTIRTLDDPSCPPAVEASAGHPTAAIDSAASSGPTRRLVVRASSVDAIARATWDALVARSAYATPFSRWAFHRAWWDGYGASAHEETLVVEDAAAAGSPPVAIVPLMHRHEVEPGDTDARSTIRRGHEETLTPVEPTAKAVFFGASYHADYATVLAAPADLPEVATALVAHLAAPPPAHDDHPMPWDVVDLRRLRCGDPASAALTAAFTAAAPALGWTVVREREDVCPVVTLPEGVDFEGYLDTLDKKARHEIRRKIRRAEAVGEVALTVSTDPLADLSTFIDFHQAKWGERGLFPPNAGGDASRLFIRRLFEAFGPTGPAKLSFLSCGERRIGAGIHFDDGHTLSYYNAGIDPDARDLSPGVLLVARYVQAAIASGRRRLDFLRGDEPYKYEWGAVDEPIERILVSRTAAGAGR